MYHETCETRAPMYFHRALTWSSDVSDGVGVTDMATAAVGISEGFVLYHKVVFCFSLSVLLLWFRAGFCTANSNAHQGSPLEGEIHPKDTCLRSNFNWLFAKIFINKVFDEKYVDMMGKSHFNANILQTDTWQPWMALIFGWGVQGRWSFHVFKVGAILDDFHAPMNATYQNLA